MQCEQLRSERCRWLSNTAIGFEHVSTRVTMAQNLRDCSPSFRPASNASSSGAGDAEAVYNSMVATVTAVGLGSPGGDPVRTAVPPTEEHETARWRPSAVTDDALAMDDPDAYSYQDMSQPIEVIARRLRRYHERLTGSAESWSERQRRLLHASFIVEFGLEHGLPEVRDLTSENTLKEFLQRLGEWEGGQSSDVVRSLVLDSIPEGPAKRLRKTIDDHWSDWFEQNRTAAIVGGAVLGGILGMVVAGATLAVAGAGRARGRR